MADAWTLLRRRVAADPGSPFVTHIDAGTGDRTELSATSLANAAAKIGNALRQEFDLEPGDVVVLDLPVHWQRAAWCAGAWTAGCAVSLTPVDRPGLVVTTAAGTAGVLASAMGAPVVAVSTHPFGLPIGEPLPHGVDDATLTVRQQPDAYLFEPPRADGPAIVHDGAVVTQEEALAQSAVWAREWGLTSGGRLLAPADLAPAPAYAAAFAVPLVSDASVVLVSGATDEATDDASQITAAEHITARAHR